VGRPHRRERQRGESRGSKESTAGGYGYGKQQEFTSAIDFSGASHLWFLIVYRPDKFEPISDAYG
jgi:hypothetical protein